MTTQTHTYTHAICRGLHGLERAKRTRSKERKREGKGRRGQGSPGALKRARAECFGCAPARSPRYRRKFYFCNLPKNDVTRASGHSVFTTLGDVRAERERDRSLPCRFAETMPPPHGAHLLARNFSGSNFSRDKRENRTRRRCPLANCGRSGRRNVLISTFLRLRP